MATAALKGDGIQQFGQEPKTQAPIHDVKGNDYNDYKVEVAGAGPAQPKTGRPVKEKNERRRR